VIKNLLPDFITKDEWKIITYLGAFLIVGMILRYTGISVIFAEQIEQSKHKLTEAVKQDVVVQIDIRTAAADELELLPGIGPKKAESILDYRNIKQFDSPEELLNIKGIGAKTFLKMKPMLLPFGTSGAGVTDKEKLLALQSPEALSDIDSMAAAKQELDGTGSISKKEHGEARSVSEDTESTVYLNSASRQELISLSGIGEKKADAILAYRKQIGKFTSVEQLLEVKGIGPKTLEKNRHRLSL
jgi:competence protein ComEA